MSQAEKSEVAAYNFVKLLCWTWSAALRLARESSRLICFGASWEAPHVRRYRGCTLVVHADDVHRQVNVSNTNPCVPYNSGGLHICAKAARVDYL